MTVLFLLVPVSLGLATLAVAACLVSIRAGQFDDLESPRWRMLFDSAPTSTPAAAVSTPTPSSQEPIP